MSYKKGLMALCVSSVLCSPGLSAQPASPGRLLSIDEMFRLADENSKSIQTYSTAREAADKALEAAKAQRLPDVSASLSVSYLGDGHLWNRDFSNGINIPMPTSAMTSPSRRNR